MSNANRQHYNLWSVQFGSMHRHTPGVLLPEQWCSGAHIRSSIHCTLQWLPWAWHLVTIKIIICQIIHAHYAGLHTLNDNCKQCAHLLSLLRNSVPGPGATATTPNIINHIESVSWIRYCVFAERWKKVLSFRWWRCENRYPARTQLAHRPN